MYQAIIVDDEKWVVKRSYSHIGCNAGHGTISYCSRAL